MQTYDQFVQAWNGRPNNIDGGFGPQCVDLVNQYVQDVLGIPAWGGSAIAKWTNYPKDRFTRIENTPAGVPFRGDIIIFGGGNGHIGIFHGGGVNSFQSFDQNWPNVTVLDNKGKVIKNGTPCSFQNHSYTGSHPVLGWLRSKQVSSAFDVIVTASELNVRRDSNVNAAPVRQVHAGDRLRVIGTKEGTNVNGVSAWYKIAEGEFVSAYWTRRA